MMLPRLLVPALLSVAWLLSGCTATGVPGVSTRMAEPVVSDAASDNALRAKLVMSALDREALFTVAGIKPLSTGIWDGAFSIEDASPASFIEATAARRELATLSRWPYYADVMTFATAWNGKRNMDAYIMHIPAMRETIDAHSVFAKHGISRHSHPAEVLAVVERMPRSDRFEAYGHLFGYPQHAVRFFVEADVQRENAVAGPDGKKPITPRDFFHIPTHEAATGRFTYAVPKGHEPLREDLALRDRAAIVLAQYRADRDRAATGDAPLSALAAQRLFEHVATRAKSERE